MGSEAKLLSFEVVRKHDTKDDCWLIISEKVYNITPFLDDHPGGDQILVLSSKKDATEAFEDVGHSQNARDMLKDFYVGDIDVTTMPKGQYKPPSTSASKQASRGSSTTITMLLLPLLIMVLAYALYYYAKKDDV